MGVHIDARRRKGLRERVVAHTFESDPVGEKRTLMGVMMLMETCFLWQALMDGIPAVDLGVCFLSAGVVRDDGDFRSLVRMISAPVSFSRLCRNSLFPVCATFGHTLNDGAILVFRKNR